MPCSPWLQLEPRAVRRGRRSVVVEAAWVEGGAGTRLLTLTAWRVVDSSLLQVSFGCDPTKADSREWWEFGAKPVVESSAAKTGSAVFSTSSSTRPFASASHPAPRGIRRHRAPAPSKQPRCVRRNLSAPAAPPTTELERTCHPLAAGRMRSRLRLFPPEVMSSRGASAAARTD